MYAFGIFNPYGTLRTRIGVRCLDLIDNVESAVGFVFRKSRIADKEFNKEDYFVCIVFRKNEIVDIFNIRSARIKVI